MKRIIVFVISCTVIIQADTISAYDQTVSQYHGSNAIRPVVSISEAMVNPPTGEGEWVELYNSSSIDVELDDWHIDDIANGGSSVLLFSGYIEADGYLVIPIGSSVFNNGGDDVRLLDENEREIDLLRYSESEKNTTWARGLGEVTYCLQEPTKGTKNQMCRDLVPTHTPKPSVSLPSPTPTSSPSSLPTSTPVRPSPTETPTPAYLDSEDIYISEVMVAPETGHKEWIELYNASDQTVFLKDWSIDDEKDAGSSPKLFSAEIPGQGYYFHVLSSGIFNNGGDHVRIISPTEQEVERFTYTSSEKGKTWGRPKADGNTFCLQEATPGFANTDCIDNVGDDSLVDQAGSSIQTSEIDEQVRSTSETRLSSSQNRQKSYERVSDDSVRGLSTLHPDNRQLALYQDTVKQAPLSQDNRASLPQVNMDGTDSKTQLIQGRTNSVHDTVIRVLAGVSILIASVVALRLGIEFRSQMASQENFFPKRHEQRY